MVFPLQVLLGFELRLAEVRLECATFNFFFGLLLNRHSEAIRALFLSLSGDLV
jgi:hypothetical protein